MAPTELVAEDDQADGLLRIKAHPGERTANRIDRRLLLDVHRAAAWRVGRGTEVGRGEPG
eukprot:COSAG06_NODE_16336_length_1006_cov_25.046307_1_plen_59_part_10